MKPMTDTAARTDDGSPGFRALVVDDEVALAEIVASYLVREHFDTRVAHDGATAVALARDHDPDVVILELGLPGRDGREVCSPRVGC